MKQDSHTCKCVTYVSYEGADEQFVKGWAGPMDEKRLLGFGVMVTEDFVVLFVDLDEMHMKVFW